MNIMYSMSSNYIRKGDFVINSFENKMFPVSISFMFQVSVYLCIPSVRHKFSLLFVDILRKNRTPTTSPESAARIVFMASGALLIQIHAVSTRPLVGTASDPCTVVRRSSNERPIHQKGSNTIPDIVWRIAEWNFLHCDENHKFL